MMKKIIARFSAWLRQRMHNRVINAAPWYVGDPCYIIPDDQWEDFCNATYANRPDPYEEHVDSVIDWHGQKITVWTNGGDGTWGFDGLESANSKTSFGVDAGIFCVINLNALPTYEGNPITSGILFEREPDLYVEDGCVYLNRIHDDAHMACENWRCGCIIGTEETITCGNGCCEGCDNCGHGWECEEE
jgi:hypothetical protein